MNNDVQRIVRRLKSWDRRCEYADHIEEIEDGPFETARDQCAAMVLGLRSTTELEATEMLCRKLADERWSPLVGYAFLLGAICGSLFSSWLL